MRYAVTIVSPQDWVHAETVREVAETLEHALQDLGHEVIITKDPRLPGYQHILLNAIWLPSMNIEPLEGSIIYNLEQVYAGSRVLTPQVLDLYRRFPVWDYCPSNVEALGRLGIPVRSLVPVGWMPQMSKIVPTENEDIDVLFYGEMTDRRKNICNALEKRELKVHVATAVYGQERDALIARAKLVLNVHSFAPNQAFEVVRVSYLLGNGKIVVSETGLDKVDEGKFSAAVVFAKYDNIPDICVKLIKNTKDRSRMSAAGRKVMSSLRMTKFLSQARGPKDNRNLVLGACGGYSFDQIAPFVRSLRATKYDGDIVFLDYGLSEDVKFKLSKYDVIVQPLTVPAGIDVVHQHRFGEAVKFLRSRSLHYDRVLLTDVRDVVFQKDPFSIDVGPGLAVFGENGTIGGNGYNNKWINALYGPAATKWLADKPIVCSGTTIGSTQSMIAYLARMEREDKERPGVGLEPHDQGLHNYLFYNNELDDARLFPNGIGVFTLCLVEPKDVKFDSSGLVKVGNAVPAVLHQYDRHPVLNNLLQARWS